MGIPIHGQTAFALKQALICLSKSEVSITCQGFISQTVFELMIQILYKFVLLLCDNYTSDQVPVQLSIFRSNSKFDENSKHSSVKYKWLITMIFCTRHNSVTVVTCAKYPCDRSSIFETRAFWIFIEFRIRSKYALWDGRQVMISTCLRNRTLRACAQLLPGQTFKLKIIT